MRNMNRTHNSYWGGGGVNQVTSKMIQYTQEPLRMGLKTRGNRLNNKMPMQERLHRFKVKLSSGKEMKD